MVKRKGMSISATRMLFLELNLANSLQQPSKRRETIFHLSYNLVFKVFYDGMSSRFPLAFVGPFRLASILLPFRSVK